MGGILVVFGTRPEAIKLWPVVEQLRERGAAVQLCSTGQHDQLLDQALCATAMKPDHSIRVSRGDASPTTFMAALLPEIAAVIERVQPAWLVVQGDTTSALTAAIAAHHLAVPVAHVEAGLRSGSNREPWPEEFNRRAISAIADLHFAPTELCAQALRAEGTEPERIFVTGNTGIDALSKMRARIRQGPAISRPAPSLVREIGTKQLVLVTAHRREHLDGGLARIASALRRLAERPDVHIVLPLHANPIAAEPFRAALSEAPSVTLLPAVTYPALVHFLDAARLIITDSGGIQEEAAALGKTVIVLRERTERVEAVSAGTAYLVGTDPARILSTAHACLDRKPAAAQFRPSDIYGDGHAAERIAAQLLTDLVVSERYASVANTRSA